MAVTNKWITPLTYPIQRQAWKLQTGWALWWKLQTSRTVRWIIMFSHDCLNSKISVSTSTTCTSTTQEKNDCFSSFKPDRWKEIMTVLNNSRFHWSHLLATDMITKANVSAWCFFSSVLKWKLLYLKLVEWLWRFMLDKDKVKKKKKKNGRKKTVKE